ncbi:MAG: phosphomannomutase [Alphaproteobacteria bacterium]|nr:phosphomannomutase [Alphaproteobacteria bacterium]
MTATGHKFHPTILREYDIRGVVGETLDAKDALALGRTFGSVLCDSGGSTIAVGYDGRLSSPELVAALHEGLRSTGLSVVDIGMGPTPMLYFAARVLGTDAGIMVTGSHNPSEFNGFKMVLFNKAFWGPEIQKLGVRAEAGDWRRGAGSVRSEEVLDRYVARLAQDYRAERGLRVAWDAGNGAAAVAMTRLTAMIPGTHILLNETVDGTFPAHHPDPTVEKNLAQLREAVAREKCDLGVAFDGDGDRIGVVDGKGRVLWGDQILAILARDLLARVPGATVIADVKASDVLFEEVARLGGKPVMSATGHSIIKTKMAELGAALAGEMSGHIFIGDGYYGYDDGLYAAVRLIDIVARSGSSMSALRDSLPNVLNTPEIRFEVPEERKFALVDDIRKKLIARSTANGADISTIDGVRVKTADGWWLLRASNTQNVLVVRCESATADGLERLKATVAGHLRESGVAVPADF